jgi:hypothetical protein
MGDADGDVFLLGSNALDELRLGSYDGASRRGSLEGRVFRPGPDGTTVRGRTGSAARTGAGLAGSSSQA